MVTLNPNCYDFLVFFFRDWIVCAEVIKLVRYYMMFGGVEGKDAPRMIGARNRELITLYLQGQSSFPPTDKPYVRSHYYTQHARTLATCNSSF